MKNLERNTNKTFEQKNSCTDVQLFYFSINSGIRHDPDLTFFFRMSRNDT